MTISKKSTRSGEQPRTGGQRQRGSGTFDPQSDRGSGVFSRIRRTAENSGMAPRRRDTVDPRY